MRYKKHVVLISLVVFGSMAGTSCSSDPQVLKRKYLESGDKYFAEKKYREAIIEYRNAVQQDAKFGEARYKLAEAYAQVNEPQNAIPEYVRAADLLPDNVDAQLKAGGYFLLGGRFEDAKMRAEKVLEKDPRNVDAQILLGNSLAGLKNLEGAIAEIEKAIQLDPMQSRYHSTLGALQMASGRRQESEAAFKRAVEVAPKSVTAHLALAQFYWLAGRATEAEQSLKSAKALEPRNLLANRALALFYLGSNRSSEAEPYLKTVADVSGGVGARIALADYYLATQRQKEAIAILEVAATDKAAFGIAKSRLAAIEYSAGRRSEGHKIIDEVLAREPGNSGALLLKGQFLMTERKFDEALTRVQAAVTADPRLIMGHYTLGKIHVARADLEEATKKFNEVLRLDPRSVEAKLELAWIHLTRGTTEGSKQFVEQAVQFAEEATKSQPQNPDAHLLLARALMVHGDVARAASETKTLETYFPRSEVVHAQMGRIYLMNKDSTAATKSFNRALELNPNSIEALSGLIALDLNANRLPEARAKIDARLAKNPSNPDLLMLAAQTYASSGDVPRAELTLRKLIEVQPANLQAYQLLGQVYLSERKLEEARREFEQLAKRQPKSVPAHTMVAMILQAENKVADAQKRYEQVLEIDSRAAVAANNLAWIYADGKGNLDVALQLAQTAKERMPDQPEVNDTLGWIYYKKDLPTLAIQPFRESVAKDPKNAVYHYHLGLAYEKSGDAANARQSLEQALKLKPDFDGAADARRLLASLKG